MIRTSIAHTLISTLLGAQLFSASIEAVYVETPPRIDGKIIEPVWQQAAVISEFIQREPHTGAPASEKTVAYVCYDQHFLFVAFKCHDDPARITAKQMARDATLMSEDKVVIMLDTFLDRRNSYWFEINPRGSMGDALFSQNGAVMNKEWDGIWEGRSSIHADGWDTEVAIPFKTLNFHPSQTTWGLKLIRDIQHRAETSYWPTANINSLDYQISDAGELVGLRGMTQGIGLDFRPYALAGAAQKRAAEASIDGNVGVDLFYQLTAGLKSVLTINTDFAQTEVDGREVNLTRFPLFFPEKRDFFLDGSNYFRFAVEGDDESPKSRQLIPFFTRRIGLGADGAPIPILGGLKLTGQSGPWNLGILDVLDARETGRQNFVVLRASRYIGAQSAIGLIGTRGNAATPRQNSVIGADLKLATSTWGGDKNIVYYLFGLKSSTDSLAGRDMAFGSEISYPNDLFQFRLGYMQIEENFIAGVGFVPRTNMRDSYGSIAVAPRPHRWGILQIEIAAEFDYITDLTNRLLTREIEFKPLDVRFLTGDNLSLEFDHTFEALDRDFNIYGDYIIPAGRHEFLRPGVCFASAQRRRLWAEVDYEWGEFWQGSADQIELAGGYKVSVPVALEFQLEHNDVRLPAGAFSVDVYRVNLDLLFSPRMTLVSFIQYDDESGHIGWQSRFRWILQPGNEIFVVWNSLWDPAQRMNPHWADFRLAQSTTQIKINYNYRF
ncbi:carbohydrate binding family 9 domain-containing protein [candidate division KSB1 bacterium]|nr:carbohydrate binding family 9 domain-containing protein [candidate division KSB1 bacterium]